MRHLPSRALLKIPRQERSIEMVHTILDSVGVVLVSEGASRLTTNRVAETAGVSVGSLYQYFANREMLLQGVLERGMLESEELMRELSTMDPDAAVEDVLRTILEAMFERLEPIRGMLSDLLSVLPLGSQSGLLGLIETRIGDLVRDYLLRHSDRYRLVGGSAALYVGTNGIIYVFLRWLTDPQRSIKREELMDALVAAFTSAIQPA
jgi:AcrR family transcriptional regulator